VIDPSTDPNIDPADRPPRVEPVTEVVARDPVTITFDRAQPGSLIDELARMDVGDLEVAMRGAGRRLSAAIRESAAAELRLILDKLGRHRPTTADVADLTRRLYAAHEVLAAVSKGYGEAAKAAFGEIGEVAQIVNLGQEKPQTVRVPYGDSTRIVARPKYDRVTTWDDTAVTAVLADVVVAEHGDDVLPDYSNLVSIEETVRIAYVTGLRRGARHGIEKARQHLLKAEWKVTAVKALAETLMRRHNDTAASTLQRAQHVQRTPTGEYEVTTERT
jgi:hypothetical protein